MTTDKKHLKVGFLTWESHDHACPYIRLKAPLAYLHQKNALTLINVGDLSRGAANLNLLNQLDLLVMQRKTIDILSFRDLMKLLHKPCPAIVYEIDDAFLHLPSTNPHYHEYSSLKPRIIEYLSRSHMITVPTQQLKELYQANNKNIIVLPNYIDPAVWIFSPNTSHLNQNKPSTIKSLNPNLDPLVAKSPFTFLLSGTATHARDLTLIVNPLVKILNENKNQVKLIQWGLYSKKLAQLPNVKTIPPILNYRHYAKTLQQIRPHLALIPLEDNTFNRAKSNIKWLEYSICRIPGIYSAVPPYTGSIIHESTGLLVENTQGQWYKALKSWYNNPAGLRKIGENAYHEVLTRYSLQDHAHEWLDAYKHLVPGNNTSTFFSSNPEHDINKNKGRDSQKLTRASIKINEQWYRKIITLKDICTDYLSTAYFRLGEIEEAKGNRRWRFYYKKSIEILLDKHNFKDFELYRIASSYKKIGKTEIAQEYFYKIIKKPSTPNVCAGAFFHLGEILYQQGEWKKAQKMFSNCLNTIPNHKKAREYTQFLMVRVSSAANNNQKE